MSTRPFYILACDGGGVRGKATVKFLYEFTKYMKTKDPNFKLYDFFDMYAGTSVGALIILMISACKYDEDKLMEVFNDHLCREIMDKSVWDKLVGLIQHKPKYDGEGKRKAITKHLGDIKLSEIDKYVVIPTYNITEQRTQIFHSDQINETVLCREIADATSAAPAYFPSVKITNCNNKNQKCKEGWFIDGGVVANNPTICAIAKAKRLLKNQNRKIVVLNIGTGHKTRYLNGEEAQGYGGIEWLLHNIIGITMDETVINEQATDLLANHHYININGNLDYVSDDIDDCSDENLENLEKMGLQWWNENKSKFENFLELH